MVALSLMAWSATAVDTPVFQTLSPKSPIVGVVDRDYVVVKKLPGVVLDVPANNSDASRLRYVRDCMRVSDGRTEGWVIDGITLVGDGAARRKAVDFKGAPAYLPAMLLAFLACAACAAVAAIRLCRQGWKPFLRGKANVAWILAALVALRLALLSSMLFRAGDFLVFTYDEEGYYNTGRALLGQYDLAKTLFTFGNSALHALFIWLFHPDGHFQLIPPLAQFNAMFVGSLVVVMVFGFALSLTRSRPTALLAAGLWALYPYLVQVNHTALVRANDLLGPPDAAEYSETLFHWTTLSGFDALGDTPGLAVVLATFLLALKFGPLSRLPAARPAAWLLVGAFFGFSGTVRVSNIYMLPALVFLAAFPASRAWDFKRALASLCWLGAGMVVGFSPQLWLNYASFHSLLTLPYQVQPYHLENSFANRGFELEVFWRGLPFSLGATSLLFSLAAPGLSLLRGWRARALCSLYVLPMFLFYSGYVCVLQHPIRWFLPVYPALCALAALALRERWHGLLPALVLTLLLKPGFPVDFGVANGRYALLTLGLCLLAGAVWRLGAFPALRKAAWAAMLFLLCQAAICGLEALVLR